MAIYACSDLHGQFNVYEAIKNFIQPEDIVYCLGDCGDRGPHSWKTIKQVYNDAQFKYLKGNHEDMLIKAMRGNVKEIRLLAYNGGYNTYCDWQTEDETSQKEWLEKLSKLPILETYINKEDKEIILCHAGYTPHLKNNPNHHQLLWSREHFWETWDEENFSDTIIVHGHTPIPYLETEYDLSDNIYCNGHKINIDYMAFATESCILLDLDTLEQHIIEG